MTPYTADQCRPPSCQPPPPFLPRGVRPERCPSLHHPPLAAGRSAARRPPRHRQQQPHRALSELAAFPQLRTLATRGAIAASEMRSQARNVRTPLGDNERAPTCVDARPGQHICLPPRWHLCRVHADSNALGRDLTTGRYGRAMEAVSKENSHCPICALYLMPAVQVICGLSGIRFY